MESPLVLSHRQVEPVLAARRQGVTSARLSPDLGLSEVEVALCAEFVQFPDGQTLDWTQLAVIAAAERQCFIVEHGQVSKIQRFSEATNRLIGLVPTASAPAMQISGLLMHRIKDTTPDRDTQSKVQAIAPIVGRVLDTMTGLGYTAIAAAKTAKAVVTIELDPAVLAVARRNPWSRALFENPKITQIAGDSAVEVTRFADDTFARILHDPPTFDLAGELYAGAFYRELFRILQRGGRLFHYIGNLDSRSGRSVATGVLRRLQDAGFRRVTTRPEAFGVIATK